MTHRLRCRASAYLLIEMLLVIAIFTLFGLLAAPLFTSAVKINREAAMAHGSLNRLDVVMDRLRADVWRARVIATPDERTVQLQWPDGSSVVWQMSDEAKLTRSATFTGGRVDEPQSWPNWRFGMRFVERGPALLVRVLPPDSTIAAEYVLDSQVLLAGRFQK